MLFGALALLVPALAGCEAGLNAPTLAYHPAAFGGYATHDGITIDNAFVLGSTTGVAVPRAGVFFAVVSQDGDRLVSISAPGTAPLVRIAGGAVNLPAQVPVDLTGPEPKVVLTGVSSPLSSGSTITLTFNFAKAGTVTMGVPVEPDTYEYATFSPPPALPAPTVTKTPPAGGSATVSASPTATP
jgi:copper(I)-binding protein